MTRHHGSIKRNPENRIAREEDWEKATRRYRGRHVARGKGRAGSHVSRSRRFFPRSCAWNYEKLRASRQLREQHANSLNWLTHAALSCSGCRSANGKTRRSTQQPAGSLPYSFSLWHYFGHIMQLAGPDDERTKRCILSTQIPLWYQQRRRGQIFDETRAMYKFLRRGTRVPAETVESITGDREIASHRIANLFGNYRAGVLGSSKCREKFSVDSSK